MRWPFIRSSRCVVKISSKFSAMEIWHESQNCFERRKTEFVRGGFYGSRNFTLVRVWFFRGTWLRNRDVDLEQDFEIMNIDTHKGRVQTSDSPQVKALQERVQTLEARLEEALRRLPPEKGKKDA